MSNYNSNHRRGLGTQNDRVDDSAAAVVISDTLVELRSRRANEREHGAHQLLKLVYEEHRWFGSGNDNDDGTTDDQLEALLEVCRLAVDANCAPFVRAAATRVAAHVIVLGDGPDTFAADFAEAIGAALPLVLKSSGSRDGDDGDEETAAYADLAKIMFHAVIVAQAVEGNAILVGEGDARERLAARMLKYAVPANPDVAVAWLRCLAVTAVESDDEKPLQGLIHSRVRAYEGRLDALRGAVQCFGIAAEAHGSGSFNASTIAPLEDASAKAEGGKEAKKALAAAVRAVAKFLESGDGPWTELELQGKGGSDKVTVQLDSFAMLVAAESVRAITGDARFSMDVRASPRMHELFGVEDVFDGDHVARNFYERQKRHEARHTQGVAEKSRHRDRNAARSRKRDIVAGADAVDAE